MLRPARDRQGGQGEEEDQEAAGVSGAAAAFRRAIGVRPDFAEPHSNLGATLAQQGAFQAAIDAIRKSIALAPDRKEAGPRVRR